MKMSNTTAARQGEKDHARVQEGVGITQTVLWNGGKLLGYFP